jgi:hypothetical protein
VRAGGGEPPILASTLQQRARKSNGAERARRSKGTHGGDVLFAISPRPRTRGGAPPALTFSTRASHGCCQRSVQYPSWYRKTLPVLCSTGRVAGLITLDDGVVRMLLEYRIRSDRPDGFGRKHSPRQCSRHQDLGSSTTVRCSVGFFSWATRAIVPAACFEFGERRALA